MRLEYALDVVMIGHFTHPRGSDAAAGQERPRRGRVTPFTAANMAAEQVRLALVRSTTRMHSPRV